MGSYQEKSRGKREIAKIREIRDRDGNTQNVVSLTCESGAKCIKFRCTIRSIPANQSALIQIPSRLWNATFLEEFSDIHHVSIKSFGQITLNPIFNIEQSEKDDKFWVRHGMTLTNFSVLTN